MKAYKDVVNNDELLSEGFPIKEDGVLYMVEGKSGDHNGTTVFNVVESHGLVETSYDKKNYSGHIAEYLKRLAGTLPEDERDAWRQEAVAWAKKVLADIGSYRFFTGVNMNPEAMVVLMKTGEDGETPFFYYIRHGLKIVDN
ncbi:translationally-controlled tumor protein [Streptomyces anulatus]